MRPLAIATVLGAVLIAGHASQGVAATAPDVRFDLSWGVRGRADVPSDASSLLPRGVVADPNGVVALGSRWLLHLTPEGVGDEAFGSGGLVPTVAEGFGAFDTNGRYVSPWAGMRVPNDVDTGVARFAADGSVDTTFANAGSFELPPIPEYGSEGSAAVGIDGNGSILLLSQAAPVVSYTPATVRLTRLTTGGAIDSGYGSAGSVVIASGPNAESGGRGGPLLVRPAGDAFAVVVDPSLSEPVTLRHVTSTGSLDTTFAGTGLAALPLSPRTSEGVALAVDAAGRILVAGVEPSASGVASAYLVVRLLGDGTRDTSFGADGVARIDVGTPARLTHPSIAVGGAAGDLYAVAGGLWSGNHVGSGFVAVVDANAAESATTLRGTALGSTLPLEIVGLATQPDGRVAAAAIEWTADGPRGAYLFRLRFDGQSGTPTDGSGGGEPPAPPPPPRGAVVVATWKDVARVTGPTGFPTGQVDCTLHLANLGGAVADVQRVRVLLSRNDSADRHDARLSRFDRPALAPLETLDLPLRLHVSRSAHGRRLLLVSAADPSHVLAVSDPLP